MTDTTTTLQAVIGQTLAADLNPIRDFLFSNPSEPLIATGSGGAETAGEFAAYRCDRSGKFFIRSPCINTFVKRQ